MSKEWLDKITLRFCEVLQEGNKRNIKKAIQEINKQPNKGIIIDYLCKDDRVHSTICGKGVEFFRKVAEDLPLLSPLFSGQILGYLAENITQDPENSLCPPPLKNYFAIIQLIVKEFEGALTYRAPGTRKLPHERAANEKVKCFLNQAYNIHIPAEEDEPTIDTSMGRIPDFSSLSPNLSPLSSASLTPSHLSLAGLSPTSKLEATLQLCVELDNSSPSNIRSVLTLKQVDPLTGRSSILNPEEVNFKITTQIEIVSSSKRSNFCQWFKAAGTALKVRCYDGLIFLTSHLIPDDYFEAADPIEPPALMHLTEILGTSSASSDSIAATTEA